jgi:hypothetical protein
MQNHRTPAELKAALDAIVAELRAYNTAAIADDVIVPLAKSVQDVAKFAETLDVQIETRVIVNGVSLPGAARKPGITHRKWNDDEVAASLAFEAFGLKAFKLVNPAAVEKLGDDGKALVAIASFKPPAEDRVVY